MRTCPCCSVQLQKVIYAGLPGKLCTACTLFMGLAAWAALVFFSGRLMFYEGSYWRALWHWLFGEKEGDQ